MSMNMFFCAFSAEDAAAMREDHALVDDWVADETRCVLAIDIEDAWDVLFKILSGVGFRSEEFLDDVMSNGGDLIDTETVKLYADQLVGWTRERLFEALRDPALTDDAYHIEHFREDEADLLREFDKLVAFYREVAAKNLAVLAYAA